MKKYIFIGLLLAPLGACKYHTTSDDFILWTKDLQEAREITDEELKDEDNVRLYNDQPLRARRKLSPEERAEKDKSISPTAGKHFDKGDLVEGGYEYINVEPYTKGISPEVSKDTIFLKFDNEYPVIFKFVKNSTKNKQGKVINYYYHLPETEYERQYVPGQYVTARKYVSRFKKYMPVSDFVKGHYEDKPVASYILYNGNKYYFYFINGEQYAKSNMVVSRKFADDIHDTMKGIPVPK